MGQSFSSIFKPSGSAEINWNGDMVAPSPYGFIGSVNGSIPLKTVVDSYSELGNLAAQAGDKVLCWEYVNGFPRIYEYNGSSWTAQENGEVPKSFIQYDRLDTGYPISFYQVEPDTTNYTYVTCGKVLDYQSNTVTLQASTSNNTLNFIDLPKNMYVIGSLSHYEIYSAANPRQIDCRLSALGNGSMIVDEIILKKEYTTTGNYINTTTTATNYTIPAKTNCIRGSVNVLSNNTAGQANYYSCTLFIGFKGV